jgi:xanthine dehydrogenase accessory factor
MSAPDPFIITKALDWLAEGRRVALATVIRTWGSAPQPVGSQLLIDADGNFLGSVSGGCVEAEVITEAADVIESGEPKALEYGVEDNTAWKVGLACGGSIRIFVEKVEGARGSSTDGLLHRLVKDVEARRQVALVTDLTTGAQSLAHSAQDVDKDLAPALEDAFRCDRSIALASDDGEIFINVFNATVRLIIVGAVHIAQQLVPMARALGHDVVILDPRTAFATEERFGDAEVSREWPDEALPKIGVDARTALIALTHDPKIDDPALIHALSSNAFYVGALGSRKTHAKRVERLLKAGVASADIERIHAPIGLDIGAQGAAEIALSIMAEITAVQRGKVGNGR